MPIRSQVLRVLILDLARKKTLAYEYVRFRVASRIDIALDVADNNTFI